MDKPRDLYDDIDHILIPQEVLQARTAELARQIEADYANADDDLLLICVLKGGFVFLADLSRALKRPHTLDFMGISSYGKGTVSGAVQILLDLKQPLNGRHVLIVEDIIDSGNTLSYLKRTLLARNPASLRICTLLDKPSRREVEVDVDYVGFEIPDEFVVGYGLDFDELYRNLPFIAVLKPSVFAHLLAADA